jgi:hypothetical protein
MKEFRGVFAKLPWHGNLWNHFPKDKSVEYVHRTVDRVHRAGPPGSMVSDRWKSLNLGSVALILLIRKGKSVSNMGRSTFNGRLKFLPGDNGSVGQRRMAPPLPGTAVARASPSKVYGRWSRARGAKNEEEMEGILTKGFTTKGRPHGRLVVEGSLLQNRSLVAAPGAGPSTSR